MLPKKSLIYNLLINLHNLKLLSSHKTIKQSYQSPHENPINFKRENDIAVNYTSYEPSTAHKEKLKKKKKLHQNLLQKHAYLMSSHDTKITNNSLSLSHKNGYEI